MSKERHALENYMDKKLRKSNTDKKTVVITKPSKTSTRIFSNLFNDILNSDLVEDYEIEAINTYVTLKDANDKNEFISEVEEHIGKLKLEGYEKHFSVKDYISANERREIKRNSSPVRGKSPNSRGRSPNNRGRSPNYRKKSPNNRNKSPNYRKKSPNNRNKSPNYRKKSPNNRNKSQKGKGKKTNTPTSPTRGRSPNRTTSPTRGRSPNRETSPKRGPSPRKSPEVRVSIEDSMY